MTESGPQPPVLLCDALHNGDCPYAGQVDRTQRLQSLGLMVSEVAHDLNNLLSMALGHAELAMNDIEPGTAAYRHMRDLLSAISGAGSFCRSMLSHSGKRVEAEKSVDVGHLVHQLHSLLRVAVPPQAEFVCTVEPDLPVVCGNSGQIREIIINLVLNASDALAGSPGRIMVEVDAGPVPVETTGSTGSISGKPGLQIRVTDSGCGMDEETRQRVFHPFFTTKPNGRGLGLTTVFGLVRTLRGQIHVESALGLGTTLFVSLPSAAIDDAPTPIPSSGPAAPRTFRGTVLLVDDEPKLLELEADILSRMGVRVLTAGDGDDAVAQFRACFADIDLVFLDVIMPRKDGIETIKELRRICSTVPVFLVSGLVDVDTWEDDGEVKPPDGVLLKPVGQEHWRHVLSRFLPGSDSREGPST